MNEQQQQQQQTKTSLSVSSFLLLVAMEKKILNIGRDGKQKIPQMNLSLCQFVDLTGFTKDG